MARTTGRNSRATRATTKKSPKKVTKKDKPPLKKAAVKKPSSIRPARKSGRTLPATKKKTAPARNVQSVKRPKSVSKDTVKKTTTKADNKPILSRKKAIQSNGQGVVPPPPEVKVESPVVAPEPKVKRTRAKKATEKEEHRSSPPAVSNKTARKKDEEYSEEKYSRSPEEEEEDFFVEPVKPRAKSPRTSSGFDDDDLLDVFEDDVPLDEDEIIPDALELDPLDVPLELLDPDLIETPRHTAPPKPKPVVRTERRQVKCDGCGQMFGWLSVERLCFSCLKKKIAARKREDEGYSSGFGSGGSSSDADEDDGDA